MKRRVKNTNFIESLRLVRVSKSLFLNMIFEQIVRTFKTIRVLPLSTIRLDG